MAEAKGAQIRSNYFDLPMLMDYWSEMRLNHHTEATTMLYGARECFRIALQEGLDARFARHALVGRALVSGLRAMGLEIFGDIDNKMVNVTGNRDPRWRRRRPGDPRHAGRFQHRDRHLLRAAARPDLAHRDDGL